MTSRIATPRTTPLLARDGWTAHRTRTAALDGWLAREDAVATGRVAAVDPVLLGMPDRETLLRALFLRFTTTLEGVLDNLLELDPAASPTATVRAAYRRTAIHRAGDWRALQREAQDPVIAELTRRQRARIAGRTGISPADVALIADQVARSDGAGATRVRRRRVFRVLAGRAA